MLSRSSGLLAQASHAKSLEAILQYSCSTPTEPHSPFTMGSNVVYTVHPLPESVRDYPWYGVTIGWPNTNKMFFLHPYEDVVVRWQEVMLIVVSIALSKPGLKPVR